MTDKAGIAMLMAAGIAGVAVVTLILFTTRHAQDPAIPGRSPNAAERSEPERPDLRRDAGTNPPVESSTIPPRRGIDAARMFRFVSESSEENRHTAERAADDIVGQFGSDVFVRWTPLLLIDEFAFFEQHSGGTHTEFSPKEVVSISPTPAVTYVAEIRSFRADSLGLSWNGEIVQGGTGRISIKRLQLENGRHTIVVDILSNTAAYRIQATDVAPYYVVMEHNPNRQAKFY